MSVHELFFSFLRDHDHPNDKVVERMIREKQFISETIDGHEKLAPTAGYIFDDLSEGALDTDGLREIVYELESRGLLRLRRDDESWVWSLTEEGKQTDLASYDKAAHVVLVDLGLEEAVQRRAQMLHLRWSAGF